MIADDVLKASKILIVDDDPASVRFLERLLSQTGYVRYQSTTDARQCLPLFLAFQPDLLLLDLMMPYLDGYAVMTQIAARVPAGSYFPILVLTADITPEAKRRGLSLGAKDFLTKPLDAVEVVLRIRNLLETRTLHQQLQGQNETLEQQVQERTRELGTAQLEILRRLALAAEYRDDDTGEHTQRVGRVSSLIAQALELPPARVELIRLAAPLHDLGKIGIPDQILLKPGKLTPEEFEEMKGHTLIGVKILMGSPAALLQLAEEIALTHHERWDGTGYAGLAGEHIPLAGRIVSVADVFDALTHARVYKPAWPLEQTVDEIKRQRGRQFDPQVVDAFLRALDHEGAGLLRLEQERSHPSTTPERLSGSAASPPESPR